MEPEVKPTKLSNLNEDWKVIKILNWTGAAIGAAPPYDFDIQKFDNLKVYRYYALILIVITIFGFLYSIIGRHLAVYPKMNLTTITMDVLTVVVLTIFNLVVIGCSAFKTDLINDLFTSLIRNDIFLQPKQKKNGEEMKISFKTKFIAIHILFLILIVYDCYVWIAIFGNQSLRYYFFKNFQYYVIIYATFRFCEYLSFIINRVQFSTNILINLVNEMHKLADTGVDEEISNAQWIRISQKIKPRQEDIMQLNLLSKIFNVLFTSMELFNKLFEWQVLFLLFTSVMEFFQTFNFLVAFASGSAKQKNFANFYFIILRVSWMIFSMILGIAVIRKSVHLRCVSYEIGKQLNKRLLEMPLEELLRDEAQEELIILNQQFMKRPLLISGVCVSPDFAFIVNVLVTLTSFAPIIIQFNRV